MTIQLKLFPCKKCGKLFERFKLCGHASHCGRTEYKKRTEGARSRLHIGPHLCKFCQKQFETGSQLGGHTTHCRQNPKSEIVRQKIGAKSKGRITSPETKAKISKSRIAYLNKNPDQVPYRLNHSSKKSYPEIIFENALIESGLKDWEYNYPNGIYSYDFAFPLQKIDVEVDGGTHQQEKVIEIDKRRDAFSKSQGWKVLRFPASLIKSNVLFCINELKKLL